MGPKEVPINKDDPRQKPPQADPDPRRQAEAEFNKAWQKQAEENRRQFQQGNRNHAGMSTGQRRSGGAPSNWKQKFAAYSRFQSQHSGHPGGQRQQSRPQSQAPPSLSKHYAALGLQPDATQDQVRKAYRQMALKYHPDKNPGKLKDAAEEKFLQIQEAYDSICEAFSRRG